MKNTRTCLNEKNKHVYKVLSYRRVCIQTFFPRQYTNFGNLLRNYLIILGKKAFLFY